MTTGTPTAIAVTQVGAQKHQHILRSRPPPIAYCLYLICWQVVGGSVPVGKHIWMEGISGWEQKEGHREGGAFTGGLLQALPFTWRWPRWHYCQPNRFTNTESQSLQLIEKEYWIPPKKCSNAQTTSEVTRELFIPFNTCLISWQPMFSYPVQRRHQTSPHFHPTVLMQSSMSHTANLKHYQLSLLKLVVVVSFQIQTAKEVIGCTWGVKQQA